MEVLNFCRLWVYWLLSVINCRRCHNMPGRKQQLRRCVSLDFCPSAWNMSVATGGVFLKFHIGDFFNLKSCLDPWVLAKIRQSDRHPTRRPTRLYVLSSLMVFVPDSVLCEVRAQTTKAKTAMDSKSVARMGRRHSHVENKTADRLWVGC